MTFDDFSHHIDMDLNDLENEFIAIEFMVESKRINDIIKFLNELMLLLTEFSQILKMIKGFITAVQSDYVQFYRSSKIILNVLIFFPNVSKRDFTVNSKEPKHYSISQYPFSCFYI